MIPDGKSKKFSSIRQKTVVLAGAPGVRAAGSDLLPADSWATAGRGRYTWSRGMLTVTTTPTAGSEEGIMLQRCLAFRLRAALISAVLPAAALGLPTGSSAMQSGGDPATGSATAAAAVAERCDHASARQFDFWLGEWEVRNPDGELIGHNEIRRIAQGCGLLERWRSAGGGRGTSVNTYDTDRGAWTQRWIGSGATLWLEGGFEAGSMVLVGTGPRSTPRGAVVDRLTWTPLDDGRVRQVWEVSRDGKETWEQVFEGLYGRIRSDTQSTTRSWNLGANRRNGILSESSDPVRTTRRPCVASGMTSIEKSRFPDAFRTASNADRCFSTGSRSSRSPSTTSTGAETRRYCSRGSTVITPRSVAQKEAPGGGIRLKP